MTAIAIEFLDAVDEAPTMEARREHKVLAPHDDMPPHLHPNWQTMMALGAMLMQRERDLKK